MFDKKKALEDVERIQKTNMLGRYETARQIGIAYYTLMRLRKNPDGEWALGTQRKFRDFIRRYEGE